MFDRSGDASVQKECRPDPEQMLQERRTHKEKIEAALSAFKLVHASNLHINSIRDNGEELSRLIGSLTIEKWNAEQRIDQLLKEIDK